MNNRGETSEYRYIERGVRQGHVLSPDLFNYYSELIFRKLEEERGLKVVGHTIINILYADDTVLLAESVEDLQMLLDIIVVMQNESKLLNGDCIKED